MPPNEGPDFENYYSEWSPPNTPFMVQTPPSEPSNSDSENDIFMYTGPVIDVSSTITLYGRIHVPLEQNLKDILAVTTLVLKQKTRIAMEIMARFLNNLCLNNENRLFLMTPEFHGYRQCGICVLMNPPFFTQIIKVTETENLEQVSKVQLKVIAREVSLQHLNIYTPNLKELVLDGSVVSSLRDLGCGLVNLKILKVNRCGLTSLDGMFGLQSLEELYATDNHLENLFQCTSLPDLKILDVRRNILQSISAVNFLALCEDLQVLMLDGNYNICNNADYKQIVKSILPKLKILDGTLLTGQAESLLKCNTLDESEAEDNESEIIAPQKFANMTIEDISLASVNKGVPSSNSSTSRLPPINNSNNNIVASLRPMSSQGPMNTQRDHTNQRTMSASGSHSTTLPEIEEGSRRLLTPSSLTSGTPICGNFVAALRNRLRQNDDAWKE